MWSEERCEDILTAFLLGMQTLDHADEWPHLLPVTADLLTTPLDNRRLTPREQLQALHAEVGALNQQLLQLNESQQLQRSLDRLLNEPNADVISWKECATWERHAKEHAEDKKTELMRRLSINMTLLKTAKRVLLSIKTNRVAFRLSTQCVSFVPTGDDAQLYQILKSGLDARCSRLDAIFQLCVARIDTADKRESCIHADGRGVDLREFGVKPFDLTTISSTLARYLDEHSHFRWHGENEVYLKRTVAASELGGNGIGVPGSVRSLSVLRRFVLQDQFVMLWEAATEWDDEPNTTRLWQQGWMVIRPFEDLGTGVSLAQTGVSTQIHSSDGSDVLILDPQMTNILQSLDAFGKRQVQIVDNMLLDATVKCS